MRRLLIATLVAAALATPAEALTLKDLMELARAGLGDEVLLALIEVDRGVYAIDPATLKQLKAAGVSDKVIAALIRSGREAPPDPAPLPPAPEPDEPAPQVVVIEHHDDDDRVREVAVPVAVPVYVGVPHRARHRSSGGTVYASDTSTFVPFQSGPPAARPAPKAEPVYWGWGGKRRPDTWDEPEPPVKPRDRRK